MTTAPRMLEHARLRLDAAELLLAQDYPGEAVSRCYFAVFAAAKAVLVRHGHEAFTHHGVQVLLYRHFGTVLDTRLFARLWQEREAYDYRGVTPEPAYVRQRLDEARRFVSQAAHLNPEAR